MANASESKVASGTTILWRPRRYKTLALVVLVIVLLALLVASIKIGSREVSWEEVLTAFSGQVNDIATGSVAKRFPRTLLAVLAGAALAVSGAVMQGVTRNPLADPGILGINMGATLAIVVGIAFFGLTAAINYIWVAIVGAACTAVLVYAIASLGHGGATPIKLALAGTATSVALVSFITAVSLPRNDIAENVRSWQIGGVGGATMDGIFAVAPFLAVGLVISVICAGKLNMLALGDELAAGLGERVAIARGVSALGAVMLCGAATAITGPIGFVGLIVPHACRLLTGSDHRWLIPFSAVAGSILLVAADVLGRIIARPAELDVAIITALIGAPFFIYIVRKQRVRSL